MKKVLMVMGGVFLLGFVAVLVMPWSFASHNISDDDYATWMADYVHPDRRLIDVAMPGAHDAFARGMTLQSPLDTVAMTSGYGNALLNPPIGPFIKGFMVRQSTTQIGDAPSLLQAGVRYFDVRLTYQDGWHVTHNYLAPVNVLDELTAIADFLETNAGEVVLLDFQWVFDDRSDNAFADAQTFDDVLTLLDDAGLTRFIIPAADVDLATLTYGEASQEGSSLLLFAKTGLHAAFFDRETHLESTWHNTDSFAELVDGIAASTNDGETATRFRVMQAVKTVQVDATGMLRAIVSWSLLQRATGFHADLIQHEGFETWLATTPIVMTDASDLNVEGFVDDLMDIIIRINTAP